MAMAIATAMYLIGICCWDNCGGEYGFWNDAFSFEFASVTIFNRRICSWKNLKHSLIDGIENWRQIEIFRMVLTFNWRFSCRNWLSSSRNCFTSAETRAKSAASRVCFEINKSNTSVELVFMRTRNRLHASFGWSPIIHMHIRTSLTPLATSAAIYGAPLDTFWSALFGAIIRNHTTIEIKLIRILFKIKINVCIYIYILNDECNNYYEWIIACLLHLRKACMRAHTHNIANWVQSIITFL